VRLVQELGVEIGERRCGTPAAERAGEAVAAAFRDAGLDPRFDEFELIGYETEEPELWVEGERWTAGPCMYSPPTPEGGVEGRIARLGRDIWTEGFFEVPVFTITDEGREVGRVRGNPFDGSAIPFLASHGHILGSPEVFVSTADSKRLDEMPGAHARLRVEGRFVPGRRDRNVIAELPGANKETVVVCAHYDSVWRGPGTIDNATGVEGVRRIAERLAGRELPRTVLFAAWAAEEIGLQGSRWFVEEADIRSELGRIVGVVNLDCIGHGDALELMVGPPELRGRAVQLVHQLGLGDRYELRVFPPVSGTDHYWFAQNKIPAISILHFPYPEYHLPTEEIELVDERLLEDAVELALALVESQLARPVEKVS
jgi:hypothetical protein